MFEIGRELKRLLSGDARCERLTAGDPTMLELLDLNLLRREAAQAEIGAGRVGVRDRPARQLEAARVWRELARRTGDPIALRKAVTTADDAYKGFATERRGRQGRIQSRCEQAAVAMLGAELFARDGLNGAAEFLLKDIKGEDTLATAALALLNGRKQLATSDLPAALDLARSLDAPIADLEAEGRPEVETLRCERADLLTAFGVRLRDSLLFDMALVDLRAAEHGLDAAYRPLTWMRVQELKGAALAGLGAVRGDVGPILDAVELLSGVREQLPGDHSPLDTARVHAALGAALAALGDAEGCPATLNSAIDAFSRVLNVLETTPMLALRASVAQLRAACLVRRAEVSEDLFALTEAEVAFRSELGKLSGPSFDPVTWAVLQLNLARIYLARARVNGLDQGEHAKACEALAAALDVFGEHGLRSLAAEAVRELERAREGARV